MRDVLLFCGVWHCKVRAICRPCSDRSLPVRAITPPYTTFLAPTPTGFPSSTPRIKYNALHERELSYLPATACPGNFAALGVSVRALHSSFLTRTPANMPTQEPSLPPLKQFTMKVDVFGPIRPAEELLRDTQRVIKEHAHGRDFFTPITVLDAIRGGGMRVEYSITERSESDAERASAVYLSRLCDLVSVVTQSPVRFYMPEEDSSEERKKMYHRSATLERTLTKPEWSWITGVLVNLTRDHPQFLAAASWYRKGLIGFTDCKGRNAAVYDVVRKGACLDNSYCFWRVIEILAYSYADTSKWSEDDKSNAPMEKYVDQLAADLFSGDPVPEILSDPATVKKLKGLWEDLSHGNIAINPELIDEATNRLQPLEVAAFSILQRIRERKLTGEMFG